MAVHPGNGLMGLALFIATGGVESQTITEIVAKFV